MGNRGEPEVTTGTIRKENKGLDLNSRPKEKPPGGGFRLYVIASEIRIPVAILRRSPLAVVAPVENVASLVHDNEWAVLVAFGWVLVTKV